MTADQVLQVARRYLGVRQGSFIHQALIDRYNRVLPWPAGYQMTYDDNWCDAFVTVVADEAGASALIGRECGVQRHIAIFKDLGIWQGRVQPRPGDVITFDWDGGGFADHIGLVESVEGDRVHTIEGNTDQQVARRSYPWQDTRIIGYARPRYQAAPAVSPTTLLPLATIVAQVIRGDWGVGQNRFDRLKAAGYNPARVQALVNYTLGGV